MDFVDIWIRTYYADIQLYVRCVIHIDEEGLEKLWQSTTAMQLIKSLDYPHSEQKSNWRYCSPNVHISNDYCSFSKNELLKNSRNVEYVLRTIIGH